MGKAAEVLRKRRKYGSSYYAIENDTAQSTKSASEILNERRIKKYRTELNALDMQSLYDYKDFGLSEENKKSYNARISEYKTALNNLKKYDKSITNDDYNGYIKSLDALSQKFDVLSAFASEDEYNKAVEYQKDREAKLSFDLEKGKSELDNLKDIQEKIRTAYKGKSKLNYQDYVNGYVRAGYGKEKAEELAKEAVSSNLTNDAVLDSQIAEYLDGTGYKTSEEFNNAVAEKEQFYNQAKLLQNNEVLTNDALSAPDFAEYAQKGKELDNGKLVWYLWDKNMNGNEVEAIRREFTDTPSSKSGSGKAFAGYGDATNAILMMSDEEVQIYDYYLGKYGEKSAEEYYKTIEPTLNARAAGIIFDEAYEGKTVAEMIHGGIVGLEKFGTGIKNLPNTLGLKDDDYITPTINQMVSGSIREDLADKGPEILGSSLGQIGYDTITTISNMIPSIVASYVTAGAASALGASAAVAQTAGNIAGNVLLGASAAGNEYAEMLNSGMNKEQARALSIAQGTWEGVSEYYLGAIEGLGTNKIGKIIGGTKFANVLEKAGKGTVKAFLDFFGDAATEGMEEVIQDIGSSVINGVMTDKWEFSSAEEEVYNFVLGALTAVGMNGGTALFRGSVNAAGNIGDNVKYGKMYKGDVNAQNLLVEEGLASDYGTKSKKLAEKYQSRLKSGKELTGNQLRKLINANEQAIIAEDAASIKSNVSEYLSELGETGNIDEISFAVADMLVGKEISPYQEKVLESSKYANRVINELNPENIKSGEYSAYLPKKLDTNRINPDVYGLAAEVSKNVSAKENNVAIAGYYTLPAVDKTVASKTNLTGAADINVENRISEDGKTKSVSTGKEITVNKEDAFASAKNGEVYLNTDQGTVKLSDIEFGTKNEALLYEAFSDLNPTIANSVIKQYDGKTPIMTYINGMLQGINLYGKYNFKGVGIDISADSFFAELSQADQKLALGLGREQANIEAKKNAEKIKTKAKGVTEKVKNNGKGTVRFEKGVKAKNKIQAKGVALAKHLASALGIEIVFFDSKQDASHENHNGWYDPKDNSIHLDINAGDNYQGTIVYTLAHELTHFIEKWSPEKYKTFSDFLIEQYADNGVSVEDLLAKQMAKLNTQDADYAMKELVADACQTMLLDSKAVEKLAALRQQDATLWEKIKEFIGNLLADIKELYKGIKPDSEEAKALRELQSGVEQIHALFEDAAVDAAKAYQSAESVGISIDTNTESASPASFSLRTWNESDYVTAREQASKDMADALGITVAKAKAYIDSVNSIAKIIAEDRVRLDYEASEGVSSFISNAEYGGSIDFSTICKKRRLLTGTFTAIQNALPNTALTADEILTIRKMMDDKGYEVSCGLCYVEGSRAKMGEYAKDFLNEYAKTNPDYLPNMAEINTPEGLEDIRKQHPDTYQAYVKYMNALAQRKPKLYQMATEYKGEILNKFRKSDSITKKNHNGGLRLQSFSDFEIIHLIDCMQVITDMSRVGLAGQAYTKVPDFAAALGDTGLKINLSLIAKDVDSNGKIVLDEKEGMKKADAERLRNMYSDNVGTIIVVFNDEQLKAAMADDFIDFIIPFHRSQWNSKQYELMGLPANAKDYTMWQNESYIEPVYNSKGKKIRPDNYMPNNYWDFSKTGKENAEAYLKMCAANNRLPKFSNLLADNGDGSYSLKADGSTDGYWKLLIDFKMYNNEGKGVPQKAVVPNFNMAEATRMLNDYKGGHQSFPVSQDVVDEFVKKYKDTHPNVEYSTRSSVDSESKILDLENQISDIKERLSDDIFDEISIFERKSMNNELWKLRNELRKLEDAERQATVKTSLAEIRNNLDKYRYIDLRSLAEGFGWEDYDGMNKQELASALREYLNGVEEEWRDDSSSDFNSVKDGMWVRPVSDSTREKSRKVNVIKAAFTDRTTGENIKYSVRKEAPPEKTLKGYKVFVVKDGKLYPPMVANPNAADTPIGVWLNADIGAQAPDSKTGRKQVKAGGKGTQGGSGSLAFRPGWHLGETPLATQFDRLNPKTGVKDLFPENFVWAECDIAADVDYQEEAMSYGYNKNGKFQHSLAGLPKLPENGYYRYRTNPNPNTVPWLITGAMKVNRLLSDAEVNEILAEKGIAPKQRQGGNKTLADLGLGQYENVNFSSRNTDNLNPTNNADIRYSLREGAKEDVEKALKEKDYTEDVCLTESSPSIIASQNGVRNLPMLMKASHIRENVLTKEEALERGLKTDSHTHYHGLGEELFLKIIGGLDEVQLAYRGTKNADNAARRENYFLLISQYKDAKGNIVNVPVYINEKAQYNRIFVDTNKIATVFGRDNFFEYIRKEVQNGNLARIKNKNKIKEADTAWKTQPESTSVNRNINQVSELKALIASSYNKSASDNRSDRVGDRTVQKTEGYGSNVSDNIILQKSENSQEKFSVRNPDATDNRTLLSNALASAAQNAIEKKYIEQYQEKIDTVNAEQEKLAGLKAKIKELSFAPGKRNTEQIRNLQDQAIKTANRINVYDKQLLRLEAMKPLKDVVERERIFAEKKAEQAGRDALNAYKERAAKTEKELMNRYTERIKRGVEGRNKTVIKNKIRNVIGQLNTMLKSGKDRANVKTELKGAVRQALDTATVLFSSLDAEDIYAVGITAVTNDEQALLSRYGELLGKRNAETDATELEKIKGQISRIEYKLKDVFVRERNRLQKTYVDIAIDELINAYKVTAESEKIYVSEAYDQNIVDRLESIKKDIKGTTVDDMTKEQLQSVYDAYKLILHSVREANKLHREGRSESVSDNADAVVEEVRKVGRTKDDSPKIIDSAKTATWNELKPIYAFERIGSPTLMNLYHDVETAESTWGRDIYEASNFINDMREKYGYDSWDFKTRHTVDLSSGAKIELSLQQMMSIYAYSKREQAIDHMQKGGFVFANKAFKKTKKGLIEYVPTQSRSFKISAEDVTTIKELIKDQIGYVDEMQTYLSATMADKGNEASNILYGIDLFKEKVYFPLRSSYDYLQQQNTPAGEVSLKNNGMTKETTPHASNPIILDDFDSVWSAHVDKMSVYHAFVVPLDNFNKVFNYTDGFNTDDSGASSVRTVLKGIFGNGVNEYISNMLVDLNGGAMTDRVSNPFIGMVGKFKKTAVAASLSVIVQQPTAILRAMALVDPKYFKKHDKLKHSEKWEQLKNYAPVAVIKEIGGFDVGNGRQAVSYLEGSKSLMDKADDFLMRGAGLADEIGWNAIWDAVQNEVAAKKGLTGEELLIEAGKRFEEVVRYTQVYDSTLSRSGFMRSKSDILKMATAFMGEPTTSFNMLYNAVLQAKRGTMTKGKALRAITAVVVSIIAANALKSIVGAGRDDDDDETLVEKYIESFTSNFISDIFVPNMLPFIRDIISIFEGWDVSRTDMDLISDLKDAIDSLSKDGSTYRKVEDFGGAVANLFGLPLKNIMRDFRSIYNLFATPFNGERTDSEGLWSAFLKGWSGKGKSEIEQYLSYVESSNSSKAKELYGEMLDKKKQEIADDRAAEGKKELSDTELEKEAKSRIKTSVSSKFRPKYIEAYKKKDDEAMAQIRKEMYATGLYGSVDAVIETCRNWLKEYK